MKLQPASRIELLEPETQALIMCHVSDIQTLHSLISASPRFYQVFSSRREYHLTNLAVQQCGQPANAWDAIKASNLPKSRPCEAVEMFKQNFQNDDDWKAIIMSPEISIPMMKLGACVEWFVADFVRDSLANLAQLGNLAGLKQDSHAVLSDLLEVERARIGRAFFRFEIYRHICPPTRAEVSSYEVINQNREFLQKWDLDEIDEIACIRDYIMRRLWSIFDQMEDDLVQNPGSVPKASLDVQHKPDCQNWFGVHGKLYHSQYMENIMSRGLSFLRGVLTADMERCAELVLSNSVLVSGFLSDTLERIYDRQPWQDRPTYWMSTFRDDIDEPSLGWHWINEANIYRPGSRSGKGPRDWGYIFWSKQRLQASGIFNG